MKSLAWFSMRQRRLMAISDTAALRHSLRYRLLGPCHRSRRLRRNWKPTCSKLLTSAANHRTLTCSQRTTVLPPLSTLQPGTR